MTKPVTRSAAATEILKRRSMRSSLVEWARHRGFEPAPHHRLIIKEIDDFLASDDEVLLLFPSHYLARYPQNSILAATHSVEFAQRWGRKVRNDIALESSVLGIELASDSQASDRWALKSG